MRPVPGLMDSPGGRPVADQVRVLAGRSTSVAAMARLMASFSASVWLPGLVTVGAMLTSSMVRVMVSVSSRLGVPSSVTVTSKV